MAVAAYGFIVGEALLPPLVVTLLGLAPWQALWVGTAVLLLAGAWPLLARLAARLPAPAGQLAAPAAARAWRRDLLLDARFTAALAVMVVSPMVVTAVFVQQAAQAAQAAQVG